MPIIPTYLASKLDAGILQKTFAAQQWQTVILKPTVGLGAAYSHRVPLSNLGSTLIRLRDEQPHREYLIQPFLESIATEGEWSFVYFNRKLSHILLKKPAPNDYRVQGIYGGTIQPVKAQSGDLLQAERILSRLPFDVLYARLDLVRVGDQLPVIEVELIEPIFSFNVVPESIQRLVNATRINLGIGE